MFALPQIFEEDIREIEGALGDLVTKSEATAALLLDIGATGESRRFRLHHDRRTGLGFICGDASHGWARE